MDEGYMLAELVRDAGGQPVDVRFLELNPAFEKLLGRSRRSLIERLRSDVSPPPTGNSLAIYARAVDGKEAVRFERWSTRRGRWYDVRVLPRDGDRFAIMYGDITVRKRAEETLRGHHTRDRFLLTLSDRLAAFADADDIADTAVELLGEELQVGRCHLAEVDSNRCTALIRSEHLRADVPSMKGHYKLEYFGAMLESLADGRPVVTRDWFAESLADEQGERFRGLQKRSQISVPLVRRGKLVALLTVSDTKPREWTDADVTLVAHTAHRIWFAIERARAEAALRESQETLRENDARIAYMLDLLDRLRSLADPYAIQTAATRFLTEHLDVARSYYSEYDVENGRGHVRGQSACLDAPRMPDTFDLADFPAQIASLREGKPIVVEDWREHAVGERGAAMVAELRVGAQITVPLVQRGRLVASLSVNDTRPRRWSRRDVDLIVETAERTWAAVERARAEAALRESEQRARALLGEATAARAQAEAANLAKDEFLATLSHELRTPLASILLWSGALRSGSVAPADLARAINAIAQSADTQSRLIEDLLELSRLAAGKLTLARSAVAVSQVVAAAADMIRPMMAAKQIAFAIEIEELGVAAIDENRLKQILGNVLGNAAKFTPERGAVTLRARAHDTELELEVEDNGEGIAPEFMPHLFERFRQEDMRETRRHMGLGIGLALTKQLVDLHGGTISAHSEGRGRGAIFRVRIPRVPPGSDAGETFIARARGELAAAPLDGTRVLLVEDDASTRDAMRWMLEHAGADVVAVAAADEALAAFSAADAPDVVVSDLGLPGITGLELVERIRDEARRSGRMPPPSCAVSAHARDRDRRMAIDAGFDSYLAKPVTAERLVEAVADLRGMLATNRA
jgi:PAS domain S-box-containing protein